LNFFTQRAGHLDRLDHFKKIIFFYQRANRLEQLNHFQKIFDFLTTGRSPLIIRPFLKIFEFFIDKVDRFSNDRFQSFSRFDKQKGLSCFFIFTNLLQKAKRNKFLNAFVL
jgi:hypothetical protein